MAGIRGKDTKPELELRRALHAQGLRFRLHDSRLPGRPDLVLPRWQAAVFVHGCFWHRHSGCRFATTPATRPEFWSAKFAANTERDARNVEKLALQDWRVATVWECALRKRGAETVAIELKRWLQSPLRESSVSIP